MTHSEIHQYTQTLRLHLLEMCRVSQRCVDYSIKAVQLGRLDFSVSMLNDPHEIKHLHQDAAEIAQDLLRTGLSHESSLRFVLASIRICDALQAIHKSALEIAEAYLFRQEENSSSTDCVDLATIGDTANRLMRFCTVALFEEEAGHAEAALRMDTGQRLVATTLYVWYRRVGLRSRSQIDFVQSTADRLDHLIWQMHEMARAIIYWLEDKQSDLFFETCRFETA
jgi:phosphate uptake regulator